MIGSLVALVAAVSAPPVPVAALTALQEATRRPLPSGPPMGGPGWTVWVPAVLFLVAAAGTWALWRHFADEDD